MTTSKSTDKIRVLQIVGGMNRGGIETWLMHILRHIDRERLHMDFLVHTANPCAYDDELRALGSGILPCLGHSRPWDYAKNFRRILSSCGPYDIVHSHLHHYSGYTLGLAKRAGIPMRIAHSHVGASAEDTSPSPLRWIYLNAARRLIRRFATIGLAASGEAAKALFGPAWHRDPLCRLLYYGIDLDPFEGPADQSVRASLGLPPDAFVIGHVGRFAEQKNHGFLLEILRRVSDSDPRTRLLLIGDGPLRPAIERGAAKLGLSERLIFAGLRSDVPRLLLGAVDVFVMPSLYEGLPLAGLEAQAAGLPCVLSDSITRELDVIPQLIRRLPLSAPASAWADQVLTLGRSPAVLSRSQALEALVSSPFGITNSVKRLESLYFGQMIPSLARAF
jgi:glycosyltransferase involved in cell wall biosynthesis